MGKQKTTAKIRVLKEFPSAWFHRDSRCIEGYSHGLILGVGNVCSNNLESSAWSDADRNIRKEKYHD